MFLDFKGLRLRYIKNQGLGPLIFLFSIFLKVRKEVIMIDEMIGEKILYPSKLGGDAEEIMLMLLGQEFACDCGNPLLIHEFRGYAPHSSGYADKHGRKWWIYVHCPKCEYDWALWKVMNKIAS